MHTDSCPNCCRRGITPNASRTRGHTTVDGYQCPDCGHTWATARDLNHYPTTVRKEDAA